MSRIVLPMLVLLLALVPCRWAASQKPEETVHKSQQTKPNPEPAKAAEQKKPSAENKTPLLFNYVGERPVPDSLSASPGGKTRLVLKGKKAQLIDAATGKQIGKELEGMETFNCHSFSPDGKYVATGSGYVWNNEDHDPADEVNRGFIDVWDAATGDLVERMPRRTGSVQAVGFSRDGKTIYYRAGRYHRGNP